MLVGSVSMGESHELQVYMQHFLIFAGVPSICLDGCHAPGTQYYMGKVDICCRQGVRFGALFKMNTLRS